MKLLIVLALLCVQSIHVSVANQSPRADQCQRDLRNLTRDTAKFFSKFGRDHDISHEDYLAIKKICDILTNALAVYSDPNYGNGQTDATTENQIADFLNGFYELHLEAVQNITHLLYYIDILLDQAEDFRFGNVIACVNNENATGCEAKTNRLRCNLVEFFEGLKEAGIEAKKLLRGLLESCDNLIGLTRSFGWATKSSYKSSGQDLLAAFKTFIAEFVPPHDIAHTQLSNVGILCDNLTAGINYWKANS